MLERVRGLVGASDEEVEAAAQAAVPSSPHTVSVHVVEAAADRRGPSRPSRAAMEEWGLGGGIVSTAAPAAAAVRLLARGAIEARGRAAARALRQARRTCSRSSSGATALSTRR